MLDTPAAWHMLSVNNLFFRLTKFSRSPGKNTHRWFMWSELSSEPFMQHNTCNKWWRWWCCVCSPVRSGVWNHERTGNQRAAAPEPHHPAEERHLLQPQDEEQQVSALVMRRNIRDNEHPFKQNLCVFQAAGVLFAGCSGRGEEPDRVSGCFRSHRWDCNHLLTWNNMKLIVIIRIGTKHWLQIYLKKTEKPSDYLQTRFLLNTKAFYLTFFHLVVFPVSYVSTQLCVHMWLDSSYGNLRDLCLSAFTAVKNVDFRLRFRTCALCHRKLAN